MVTGPGYAHKEALVEHVDGLNGNEPLIAFTHATNVMSREMEDADLAVRLAAQPVYELAHMRIPAIVMSHHVREDMHTFAWPRNGFVYLGVMKAITGMRPRRAFISLPRYERRLIVSAPSAASIFPPIKAPRVVWQDTGPVAGPGEPAMNIVALIQARMGSTRLPCKMMLSACTACP